MTSSGISPSSLGTWVSYTKSGSYCQTGANIPHFTELFAMWSSVTPTSVEYSVTVVVDERDEDGSLELPEVQQIRVDKQVLIRT